MILLAALTFATHAYCASIHASTPIPPSRDTWYTAPAGYEDQEPGTVLRWRPAPGNLTSIVANASAAYNVLFRTTNSHYQPAWAVTTLFVPSRQSRQRRNSTTSALLSYQIPYNTDNVDWSPSYAFYAGPDSPSQVISSDVSPSLGKGWFVSIPDFEGPYAAFAAGVTEGHGVLDSIRAVQSLPFGPKPDSRVALFGYSGGSIASEFAVELQVQYAPELSISGVAIGGLPNNFTSSMLVVNRGYFAGLTPLVLLGITRQYPEAREHIIDRLQESGPYNASFFLAAEQLSPAQAFVKYAYQDIFAYFRSSSSILYDPALRQALNSDSVMGLHGVPQVPMYVWKAVHDEVSPIEETDEMVRRYCQAGANILFERGTIGGHLAGLTNADAVSLAWLENVLEGRPIVPSSGCVIRDTHVNVTDSTL